MKSDMAGVRGLLDGTATLSPAYFGMVMATGIVSLAAHGLSYGLAAKAFFYLNVAAYVVIGALAESPRV